LRHRLHSGEISIYQDGKGGVKHNGPGQSYQYEGSQKVDISVVEAEIEAFSGQDKGTTSKRVTGNSGARAGPRNRTSSKVKKHGQG
jgi:hypothetical protein